MHLFVPQILFLICIHYFLYFWEQNGACEQDSDCAWVIANKQHVQVSAAARLIDGLLIVFEAQRHILER